MTRRTFIRAIAALAAAPAAIVAAKVTKKQRIPRRPSFAVMVSGDQLDPINSIRVNDLRDRPMDLEHHREFSEERAPEITRFVRGIRYDEWLVHGKNPGWIGEPLMVTHVDRSRGIIRIGEVI